MTTGGANRGLGIRIGSGNGEVLYHAIADGSDRSEDRLKSFNEPNGNRRTDR